jgi:hypothetical protein
MTETVDPECKVCGNLDTELEIATALMTSFCRALEQTNVTPMQVLQTMARALGGIYREVSAQHQNGACPCGWCPDEPQDLHTLQKAVDAGMTCAPQSDLRSMPVAGRA